MALRDQVLTYLVTPGRDTRFSESYLVSQICSEASCRPHEVWEALWALVADGLIYLNPSGQRSSTDNWRWQVSAIGQRVATSGRWEPHDPDGYLRRLRREEPAIDAAALGYLEEALRAFNARCYLASSVMLGVASERVFDTLSRSFVAASGPAGARLGEMLDSPATSQSRRFTELRKRLEPMRPNLPAELADNLTLDAVAELLRITRNDAGHPTGALVDEDTAYTHLQMAANYLKKMTRLKAHFDSVAHRSQQP
ncbi:hypothetical protein [Blastococcus sp. TF02A-26]|uniref:hypothetical protein n=1 Tax=Blastococcus sp. TF02A-26 TaxID=2250577 RepID=UPI000DEA3924|nr:hypothetical protein [Blastococcus sp. TF02A-26]RBY87444.1 hypothetical protein DQ240_07615 [Blastococcus sp. TF02A-26]